jgi:hypothetical protein
MYSFDWSSKFFNRYLYYDVPTIKATGYVTVNEDVLADWKFLELWTGVMPVEVSKLVIILTEDMNLKSSS